MSSDITNNKYFKKFITCTNEELTDMLHEAIDKKNPDKMLMMKTAIYTGLDLSDGFLLHLATQRNDIPLVAYLIQNGARFDTKVFNNNILHICVSSRNKYLLKYFLDKNVDIEEKDYIGETPLKIAIMLGEIECTKLLLDKGANINNCMHNELSIISTLIRLIGHDCIKKHDTTNFVVILKMIIHMTNKLTPEEIEDLVYLVKMNKLEGIQIIVNKFSYAVNVETKGGTILHHAIKLKHYKIIDYLLTIKMLDLTTIDHEDLSYLHKLTYIGYIKGINTILQRDASIISNTCDYDRTYIEHAILSDNSDNVVSEMIDIFVSYGEDINWTNDLGWTSLESAIQNRSTTILGKLIKLGANINKNMKYAEFFPPIRNNDPLGYAVQMGKNDSVRLLLKNNVVIHTYSHEQIKIPTSLIISVMCGQLDILKILLKVGEINKYFTKKAKKYLYNMATEEGCTSMELLKILGSENDLNNLVIDNNYMMNGFKVFSSKYIKNEDMSYDDLVMVLYQLTTVFYKLFTYSRKKYQINWICSYVDSLYEYISNYSDLQLIEKLISFVSSKMCHNNTEDLKYCINVVKDIQDNSDTTGDKIINTIKPFTKDSKDLLIEFHKFISVIVKQKLKTQNIKQIKCDSDNSEECEFFDLEKTVEHEVECDDGVDSENNIDSVFFENKPALASQMLFKMKWPVKLPQYDYIYSSIVHNNDTIELRDNKLVLHGNTGSSSHIYIIDEFSKPTVWFKSYAPNICKAGKTDENHTFSFALDSELYKYPCIERKVADPVHKGMHDHLLYFYGELLIKHGTNEERIIGCYEYFLNGYRTLFHRLFRPYNSLPNNIKKLLTNYTRGS